MMATTMIVTMMIMVVVVVVMRMRVTHRAESRKNILITLAVVATNKPTEGRGKRRGKQSVKRAMALSHKIWISANR